MRIFRPSHRNSPLRIAALATTATSSTPVRSFVTTPITASGHSRWSKIKHDKGKIDARRGANYSKLSQEIACASREGGLDSNLRLNAAIAAAKKAGMAKDKIQNAVQRGLGKSASGAALESVLVEAMGPGNVALVIDCLTDNKLRALQEVKYILSKGHGQATPSSYLFTRKGIIRIPAGSCGHAFDTVLESALEIDGTEDVEEAEEEEGKPEFVITTEPVRVGAVAAEVKQRLLGLEVVSYGIEWVPNEDSMMEVVPGEKPEGLLHELIEKLEESDEVVAVYTNAR